MRRVLSVAVLLAAGVSARGQDMPLSQIIKDGDGWRELARGFPHIDLLVDRGGLRVYHAKGAERVGPTGARKVMDDEADLHRPAQVRTSMGITYVIRPGDPPVVFCSRPRKNIVATPRVTHPSGLTLSLDETTLVVGDSSGKYLWAFRIQKDGGLSAGERYFALRTRSGMKDSGVTALTTDAASRVYACTPLGIQVFDPTGRLCGVLMKPGPGEMTALTFGGGDGDQLYVACGDTIYVRKMLAKAYVPKE